MGEQTPRFPRDDLAGVAGYTIVDADLARDGELAVAVWGKSIGWPDRPAEMYRRYYLDSSIGAPAMKFLRHVASGQVVGTLGLSPRPVLWDGQEIRAAALSHFCVVRGHRRVRPARLLLNATLEACRGRFDVVYGITPSAEASALAKLMGFRPATFLARHVKVLRHAGYLRRVLPRPAAWVAGAVLDAAVAARDRLRSRRGRGRFTVEWTGRSDPRLAALWRAAPAAAGWQAVRDEAILRWRFDGLRSLQRRYLLLHERASGRLAAWFACDTNGYDTGIFVLQDFWSMRGAGPIDPAMLDAVACGVRELGFAAIELRIAAPVATLAPWRAAGFIERTRFPVYMLWMNPDGARGRTGPYHITDLDNDG